MNDVHNQTQSGINVWSGILVGNMNGPHKGQGHQKGDMYLKFLGNDLLGLLENDPLPIKSTMWY